MPKYSPEELDIIKTYLPKNAKNDQIKKLLKSQQPLLERKRAERLAKEKIEKAKKAEKNLEKQEYEAIKTQIAEQIRGRAEVLPAQKFTSELEGINSITLLPPVKDKTSDLGIYLSYEVTIPDKGKRKAKKAQRGHTFNITNSGHIRGGLKEALPEDNMFKAQQPEHKPLDIYQETAAIIEMLQLTQLYPLGEDVIETTETGPEKPQFGPEIDGGEGEGGEVTGPEKEKKETFDRENHQYFMQRPGTVCCFYIKDPKLRTNQLKNYNFYLTHEGNGQDYLILETDSYGNAIYCIKVEDSFSNEDITNLRTGIEPDEAELMIIKKGISRQLSNSRERLKGQGNFLMNHPRQTPDTPIKEKQEFYKKFEERFAKRREKDLKESIKNI